jgi:hypothetical protein
MVARMVAADREADGQFIVAVKTTGIYCLPSCRPSRKPKPENVVFYATPEEARSAGFRACKLCHPDDFYAGHHAEEALIALEVIKQAGHGDLVVFSVQIDDRLSDRAGRIRRQSSGVVSEHRLDFSESQGLDPVDKAVPPGGVDENASVVVGSCAGVLEDFLPGPGAAGRIFGEKPGERSE